jgi:hypothetical protein
MLGIFIVLPIKVVHHTASHKEAQKRDTGRNLFGFICLFVAEFGGKPYVIIRALRGYFH